MNELTLQTYLTDVIAGALAAMNHEQESDLSFLLRGSNDDADKTRYVQAVKIAQAMTAQAIETGLRLEAPQVLTRPLGGGNTAELVEQITLHAPFVFKLDSKSKKLVDEADAIRLIKSDPKLSEQLRATWPTIYSIRREPPYAYLMEYFPTEDGWLALEDRLYPKLSIDLIGSTIPRNLLDHTLNILFATFTATIDRRHRPSVKNDYVERIHQRLSAAAELDSRFISRSLTIRGKLLRPWQEYLSLIEANGDYLNNITPEFQTIVHGDPNPGNILLRTNAAVPELKFIDPKEWVRGDYIFDVTKLTHFLEVTGPVEKTANGISATAKVYMEDGLGSIEYTIDKPAWSDDLVAMCLGRVQSFAEREGDSHWEARFELGMAANLLGLPIGRLTLKTPKPVSALICYSEGLVWLDRFCLRLTS